MAIYTVPESSLLPSGEEGLESLNPFTPIGLNKPLTVEIRHVYTGKFPEKKFLSSHKDMLVTSAFKDMSAFGAAARAVNFMRKGVDARATFFSPAATEQGTPLVSYTPAVTSPSTILTMEIVFDEFPDQLLSTVSSALSNIGGIPLFLPANGYIMAASSILKLAGNLGQALFDGKPVFSATETLDFDIPGGEDATADFRVVCNPTFDPSGFKIDPKRGLIDPQSQKTYNGDEPYILLSLDGAKQDAFANFAPMAASATVMQKFYNVKDGSQAALDTLVDALKLYNDSKFRSLADNVKKNLDAAAAGSEEKKALQARYLALLANITNDVMKPAN